MKRRRSLGIAALLVFLPCLFVSVDASAFSRGLAAKMRAARHSAYVERLQNARAAYDRGDFAGCAREARLALDHAPDAALARPAHQLLLAASVKLGDAPAAKEHRDWLERNPA